MWSCENHSDNKKNKLTSKFSERKYCACESKEDKGIFSNHEI